MLTFDTAGFRFTSALDGVFFDLNGDGVAERVAWTEAGSRQAFLCMDRDGNGLIDDGRQLFGDATAQDPSPTPHGFRALALLDENGDGLITAADTASSSLCLWFDFNHDGVSQANELYALLDMGVRSISLDYKVINRRDRFGNLFRYMADVHAERGVQHHAFDVFLQELAD